MPQRSPPPSQNAPSKLQLEHAKRRRQRNSLAVGITTSVLAGPMSSGTSLVGLAYAVPRYLYVRHELHRAKRSMMGGRRAAIPALPLTRRDYVIPLAASAVGFAAGIMADGVGAAATAAADTADIAAGEASHHVGAVIDGILNTGGQYVHALTHPIDSITLGLANAHLSYSGLGGAVSQGLGQLASAVADPAVLASTDFAGVIGEGVAGALADEGFSRCAEAALVCQLKEWVEDGDDDDDDHHHHHHHHHRHHRHQSHDNSDSQSQSEWHWDPRSNLYVRSASAPPPPLPPPHPRRAPTELTSATRRRRRRHCHEGEAEHECDGDDESSVSRPDEPQQIKMAHTAEFGTEPRSMPQPLQRRRRRRHCYDDGGSGNSSDGTSSFRTSVGTSDQS